MSGDILSVNNLLTSNRFKMVTWLINYLEGFKAKIYNDLGGIATIGYGHEIMPSTEADLGLKFLSLTLQQIEEGLTEIQAQRLLGYDLFNRANLEKIIEDESLLKLDHVWTALTSFCFNIGDHHFKQSDAFKLLESQQFHSIADSMMSWRSVHNNISEGIIKRRFCEIFVLLDQSLDFNSSVSPSEQFQAPIKMNFTDESWEKLSLNHKKDTINFYQIFKKNFPSAV